MNALPADTILVVWLALLFMANMIAVAALMALLAGWLVVVWISSGEGLQ